MYIILDFKEAESSNLLELSNKIKKLLNTFSVLKIKIILKSYNLDYYISKETQNEYFNCTIEIIDDEKLKKTNFVKYLDFLKEDQCIFESMFASYNDFGYTGIKVFNNKDIDNLISESTSFLFMIFKIVRNIIFI